jgi:hypothetical protein
VRIVTKDYFFKTMRNGCESIIAAAAQQNVPHGHNARRSLVFTGCHEFDRER